MNLEKQQVLLEMVLSSPDLFAMCHGIMKPSYFDPEIRSVVTFSKEYFDKYKTIPRANVVKSETGVDVSTYEVSKDEVSYVADEMEIFCRDKAVEAAILSAPALLEKQDMGKIIEQLKEAISVGLNKDLGTDYFANPELRLQALLENDAKLSTGWKEVDEKIGGGVSRQELLLFGANSGVGKSVTMLNLSLNLLMQKLNGIYFTFELAEKVVSKRMDSMISRISQMDILRNISKVAIEVEKASANLGHFYVKRMAESVTNINHIRAYLKEFQQKHGYTPDFIVLDYLDLMATTQKISAENLFVKDKYIAEEVRSLGFEFDCLIISASQLGRGALEAEQLHQGHIQGGISKVNTADNFIAIVQSEQMRAAGEYMFEYLKTRNSAGVGQNTLLRWDPIALRITDNVDNGQMSFVKKNEKHNVEINTNGTVFAKATNQASSLLTLMKT